MAIAMISDGTARCIIWNERVTTLSYLGNSAKQYRYN
jgi:hypothetical protein